MKTRIYAAPAAKRLNSHVYIAVTKDLVNKSNNKNEMNRALGYFGAHTG